MSKRFRRYRAFWPYYVSEHSRPGTRRMHFIGTTGSVALVVVAGVLGEPLLLIAALVCGYFFAWLSHLLIERNRPATFTYPLFSLAGDFHMWALMWQGRMDAEVERLSASAKPDQPGIVATPAARPRRGWIRPRRSGA